MENQVCDRDRDGEHRQGTGQQGRWKSTHARHIMPHIAGTCNTLLAGGRPRPPPWLRSTNRRGGTRSSALGRQRQLPESRLDEVEDTLAKGLAGPCETARLGDARSVGNRDQPDRGPARADGEME